MAKGLEAKAYVPQYLLYNVIWKGARKKTQKTMVQVLLFAIHFCLVTNKQFCVNNFMEWNRFYIHTYIKYFHRLYMHTERNKKGTAIIPVKHPPPATLEFVR